MQPNNLAAILQSLQNNPINQALNTFAGQPGQQLGMEAHRNPAQGFTDLLAPGLLQTAQSTPTVTRGADFSRLNLPRNYAQMMQRVGGAASDTGELAKNALLNPAMWLTAASYTPAGMAARSGAIGEAVQKGIGATAVPDTAMYTGAMKNIAPALAKAVDLTKKPLSSEQIQALQNYATRFQANPMGMLQQGSIDLSPEQDLLNKVSSLFEKPATKTFNGKLLSRLSEPESINAVEQGVKPLAFVSDLAENRSSLLPSISLNTKTFHTDTLGKVVDSINHPMRIFYSPGNEAKAKHLADIYKGIQDQLEKVKIGDRMPTVMTEAQHRQIGKLLGYSPQEINDFIGRIKQVLPDTKAGTRLGDVRQALKDILSNPQRLQRGSIGFPSDANPINAYRGTGGLNPASGFNSMGKGTYYTTNPDIAKTFGNVTQSALQLKNPLMLDQQDQLQKITDRMIKDGYDDLGKWAASKGYDGVMDKQTGNILIPKALNNISQGQKVLEELRSIPIKQAGEQVGQATVSQLPTKSGDVFQAINQLMQNLTPEEVQSMTQRLAAYTKEMGQ